MEVPESGLVAGTLVGSDVTAGFALEDVEAVEDLSEQDALSCAPQGVPFDLDWLVEGRCPLSEVDGVRVVVSAETLP